MTPVKIGIIGCGNISGIYFTNGTKKFNRIVEIAACADLDLSRAQAKAEEFGIDRAITPEQLLADPDIEIIVNLTIPNAHYSICKAALEGGKHVYVEKPLAISREEGKELVELAQAKKLRLGAAPDTFLGGGIQTCRKLIDDGWIGEPVAATAFMMGRGHESWHPAPEFYYKAGGGPMFDMGPYYLTALTVLIGPIQRITGSARATFSERTITSQPLHGTKISVDIPTHIAGVMDFANGAVGTIITSFDVFGFPFPNIVIFGSEGTLQVPDPNSFGGPVLYKGRRDKEYAPIPLTHGYSDNSRCLGVADIASAIQTGRGHRASGELGLHVLEAMHAFHDASDAGIHYTMKTTTERPAALPASLRDGELD
ncbi:MAG: Gfo/Idh/MocA family oxidoreductase [Cytophagales bacterium]|nr:Gfo/Idh/MocA family oxidoreductase [Armatimonadota bacterium]